ncbi:MAG: metallophosphoesterase, partial [Caulobacteraceae bacterium]
SLVVHGHAHRGAPEGKTHKGVPVYNVALPVLRTLGDLPYRVFEV